MSSFMSNKYSNIFNQMSLPLLSQNRVSPIYYLVAVIIRLISNVSPTYGIISKDGAIRIPNAFLSSYEQFTANNITTLDDFMEEI